MTERAGYTVSMFVIDTSPSMGELCADGQSTRLERALRYVKLKVQELVHGGRKTDQCGIIIYGSNTTDNIVVRRGNAGYDTVQEYIPIAQPTGRTLAQLDALRPGDESGDALDALIVALEDQEAYLGKKKWTRKITLLTDAESPIEAEDWQTVAQTAHDRNVKLSIVGVDFNDEEVGYSFEDQSTHKTVNQRFFAEFINHLNAHSADEGVERGVVGNLDYALQEIARPDVRVVRSQLAAGVLRIGDLDAYPDEAIQIMIKTSKATALTRPATLKKWAMRDGGKKKKKDTNRLGVDFEGNVMEVDEDSATEDEDEVESQGQTKKKAVYAQVKMRSEFWIDRNGNAGDSLSDDEGDLILDGVKKEDGTEVKTEGDEAEPKLEQIQKEDLTRGYKYGTTYAPCSSGDGQFPKRETVRGMEIHGFFPSVNFRRELSMGEVFYVWGDDKSPAEQLAFSSLVQAMAATQRYAIARWVQRDGADPRMGVLAPTTAPGEEEGSEVDALLWVKMPFSDDVRKCTFASLDRLVNKKGELVQDHPYLPTPEIEDAMDTFVDAMDLNDCGDRDEETGERTSWFSTTLAFNPAVHRVKQALFHSAVVNDLSTNPLPPPHPDLLTYLSPPARALKRANKGPLARVKEACNVKEVPKRAAGSGRKKEGAGLVVDDDDEMLLLDVQEEAGASTAAALNAGLAMDVDQRSVKVKEEPAVKKVVDLSDTEDEDEDFLLGVPSTSKPTNKAGHALPTPARSVSPVPSHQSKRIKLSKDADTAEDSATEDEDDDGFVQVPKVDIDPGRAPGRIIGSTRPLVDFQANTARTSTTGGNDLVSKAVSDLSAVLLEITVAPFAGRRTDEVLECMKAMRGVCLEEDEVEQWNAFIHTLKTKCVSQTKLNNKPLWEKVKAQGRALSYITDREARRVGASSQYGEREADELMD